MTACTVAVLGAFTLIAFMPAARAVAQSLPLPDDSVLSVSANMRSWRGVGGIVSAPGVNATMRWRSRFAHVEADVGAVPAARDGSGFAMPYVLDGSLRLGSAPLRLDIVRAEFFGGIRRDAFDPTQSWVQASAGARLWVGSVLQGAGFRAERFTPFGVRAMPGATEYEFNVWRHLRRGMRVTVGTRNTMTTELVPLTGDSSGVPLDLCVLDYDPSRPLQQYRTMCPRHLVSGDIGASLEHVGDRRAGRLFLGHRYEGGISPDAPAESWLGASFERRITPRLAIAIGAERRPTEIVRGVPAHNRFTVGFRTFPRVAATRSNEREPRDASPVRVARQLVLEVPQARKVEVRGDLTEWRIEVLTPERNGSWRLPIELRPGRYLVEMRVDGGAWQAPPGLPTTSDGFGGTVGALIVEGR